MNFPDTIIGFAVLDFDGRLISYSETSIPPLIDDLKQELNIFDDEFSKPIFVQLRKTNTCAKIYHESTRILIIFQDLSQWVNIQEINKELEAIIHHSHDGIYVTDGTGTTLRVSAGSERNFGIEARKLVGRNVQDIEKEGIFQPSVARLVLEKRERVTVYQKTAVGTVMLATGNPIFNEQNEIVRVICNSRDVTELTQLKEQIKKKEEMVKRYESELYELRSKETSIDGFIIHSKKMTDIVSLLQRIAPVNSTVLINGESGTGKEVIAKSIHSISSRNQGPFIKVNCGAIPENLLESELFGYDTGAFTGAKKGGKPGYFELADKGTLFLDEIGEMPVSLQAKLLQAIQDKTIQRVGGTKPIAVDFRLIAATNRNLKDMVAAKSFREDLFYRLNVIPITIPPLRERKEDIPFLVHFFLEKYNKRYGMQKKIEIEDINLLCDYHWPGNVRQLQNLVERLIVLSLEEKISKDEILSQFRDHVHETAANSAVNSPILIEDRPLPAMIEPVDLREILRGFEKELIQEAIKRSKSTRKAAKFLNISQPTLVRKLRELQLEI